MIEKLNVSETDSSLSKQPDQVDEDKYAIEDNTVDGEPDKLENGINVSFKKGGDANKWADNASPLHWVHIERNFLGNIEVLDLLNDSGRDLVEVGGDQQVVGYAHEKQ